MYWSNPIRPRGNPTEMEKIKVREIDWPTNDKANALNRDELSVARRPLLALSRHRLLRCECPLSGVKRTRLFAARMS